MNFKEVVLALPFLMLAHSSPMLCMDSFEYRQKAIAIAEESIGKLPTPSNQPEEFVHNLYCDANALCAKYNLPLDFVLTIAAAETKWGHMVIRQTNNLFNIKGSTKSGFMRADNDLPQEKFRRYTSYKESLEDFCRLMVRSKRYRHVLRQQSSQEMLIALANSGYATAPKYEELTLAVNRRIQRILQTDQPVYGLYATKITTTL